jgi:hypothetical protein
MTGLVAHGIVPLIGSLGGGLMTAFSTISGAIPGIGALIGAAGPIGLAVVAIAAAIGVFALAWQNNWFGIRDKLSGVVEAMNGALDGFVTKIGEVKTSIGNAITGISNTLSSAWESVCTWATNVVNKAKNAYESAKEWLNKKTGGGSKKSEPSESEPPSTSTSSTSAPSKDDGPSTGAEKASTAKPKTSTPERPRSYDDGPWGGAERLAATGFHGMVSGPTRFLAGEAGPEMVHITPISQMGSSMNGANINVYINTGPVGSPQDVDMLYQRFSRKLRNDIKGQINYTGGTI